MFNRPLLRSLIGALAGLASVRPAHEAMEIERHHDVWPAWTFSKGQQGQPGPPSVNPRYERRRGTHGSTRIRRHNSLRAKARAARSARR